MSPDKSEKNINYISLSEAILLVPYTRDYLGRLARAQKIISKQIDKQWLVDKNSVLHFHQQSTLEESIKKRILSLSRKNDLEVKETYRQNLQKIVSRQNQTVNHSLLLTVLLVTSGLFSGILLQGTADLFAGASVKNVAQVAEGLKWGKDIDVNSMAALSYVPIFNEYEVIETDEKIPMEQGILLFPKTSDTKNKIPDLFSDEVSVVLTSTTTGFIRLAGTESELPFVRVPEANPL